MRELSNAMGARAESRFAKVAAQCGMLMRHATPDEDRREHWDMLVSPPLLGRKPDTGMLRIEVKAMKRIRRGDARPSESYMWLELETSPDAQGRRYPGWARESAADYFAFEQQDGFLCVPRATVATLASRALRQGRRALSPHNAPEHFLYRLYSRARGRGLLTLVPKRDLIGGSVFICTACLRE